MKPIPKDVWVTAAALGVMVAGFAALVWYPAYRDRQQYVARLEGASDRLAKVDASQAELDRLSVEVAELREQISADAYFVPAEPELSPLLRGWTESVKKQGIQDQELITQDAKRFADYTLIPASLEFRSGFPEARAALEAIETHRRLTAVNRLSLRVQPRERDAATADPVVEASLSLHTYFTAAKEARP